MNYEQFWNDCPEIYYDYEEAYLDTLRERDMFQWQFGIYVRNAVASCLDKNAKYPQEPIFYPRQRQETNEDIMLNKFKAMVSKVNRKFE